LLPFLGIFIKLAHISLHPGILTLLYGLGIVGSGFLLSWSAEASQKDISGNLAIACIALIVVLPEYIVDIYFAWMAGKDSNYLSYPTANMTGANRLLIGIGWASVVFLYALINKKSSLKLQENSALELVFLLIPTLYSFIILLKKSLSIIDFFVLSLIFILYIYLTARLKKEKELHLIGPALFLGSLKKYRRRLTIIGLFIYSGVCIVMIAGPFAETIIQFARILRIEEFIIIQWLAPLASEAPELVVASIFVFQLRPVSALSTLISSKINQWTLLVGMIPLVYVLSLGRVGVLIFDTRQFEEFLLTACQSLLGILLLTTLKMDIKKALLLFLLFITQLFLPYKGIRLLFSILYLTIGIFLFLKGNKIKQIYNLFLQLYRIVR
jgi:cation:H+ antiporter